LYLSLFFGTCRDDYDYYYYDDINLSLLFLSLKPAFVCVLTEQPIAQLQKKHKYIEITSNKEKRKEKVMQHHQLNATVNRKKDKRDHIILRTQLLDTFRNLNLPGKISPHVVLPWRDVDENVIQLAELTKDRYCSRSDLKDDFGNQVTPVTVDDDTECQSPSCGNDDYLKFGDGAVDVDSLSKTNVECLEQISKITDDPQEEVTLHKSTRLKKLPTNKYQDFFYVKSSS